MSASYQKDKEKQERTLRRDKSLNDSDDDFIRRLYDLKFLMTLQKRETADQKCGSRHRLALDGR